MASKNNKSFRSLVGSEYVMKKSYVVLCVNDITNNYNMIKTTYFNKMNI